MAPSKKSTAKKKNTAGRGGSSRPARSNGLKTFSLHSLDESARPMMAKLRDESAAAPSFGMWGPASLTQVDPETVARNYLETALASATVPSFFGAYRRNRSERVQEPGDGNDSSHRN